MQGQLTEGSYAVRDLNLIQKTVNVTSIYSIPTIKKLSVTETFS